MWPESQALPLHEVPELIDIGLVELPELRVAERQLAADDAGRAPVQIRFISTRGPDLTAGCAVGTAASC